MQKLEMSDSHFYMFAMFGMVIIAVFVGGALRLMGFDQGHVLQVVVMILGFVSLIASQQRSATMVAAQTKEDVYTVKVAAQKVAKTVEETVEKNDKQLQRIEEKSNEIHTAVNGAHGVTLRALAIALETIALKTNDPIDQKAASTAKHASEEHDRINFVTEHKGGFL